MEADGEAGSDGKNKSRLGKISCEQSPRQHLSRVTLGATAQVLVTSGKELCEELLAVSGMGLVTASLYVGWNFQASNLGES